ncbi:hypothetical protein NC653_012686 [Populus alba x Populus x berolinensis]|uniref:Reverse transcriptase Ty1/copia-type domain-containing protein n=1 Tax=Populus alba x Populus x berolinensis TaxID=444605 RepID=A0AAD6W2J7_9ROSI|nr:hypothetical protein NC653_012686 [Populus alba x Populus x berolinensis]
MVDHGYDMTTSDHCVFMKRFPDGNFIILLLYVDDMLIVGHDAKKIQILKEELSKSFAMKNLGPAKQILGMKITRERKKEKLFPSQERYVQKVPYASAVGSLMYVMVCTMLDIAHAVGVVNRFLSNPGKEHWSTVKWILRYLKGTSSFSLCFGNNKLVFDGYTDVDMTGDVDFRKSISRYLMKFAGGAISWQSRLQKCFALFTTEAEYIALTKGGKELLWMKKFLHELGLVQENFVLHCDSQSAIHLRKEHASHNLLLFDFDTDPSSTSNESSSVDNGKKRWNKSMELPLVATGQFSDKLGEGGFGPLRSPVLEIVSGEKNTSFYHSDSLHLLEHAWKLWKYSNKALDLMDPILGDPPSTSMLLRYIKIGLLCVQQIPDDRPTMSDVISMIVKDRVSLPKP